ncbi:hypothetical protein TomMM35A_00540 [Sphingobium sp. TomMM35A]
MGLRKGGLDVRYDAFEVFHHIGIGKAQDLIAEGATVFFSMLIICCARVMALTIDLYDEVQFAAEEIGEIWAYRHLAAEFVAEFAGAELLPQ